MKSFHLRGPIRMTIRNNVIGNYDYNDYATSNTVGTYGGQQSSEDILIEDNVFENIDRNGAPDHTECLFVQSIDGLIIRGNRLEGCPVMGMFFSDFGIAGGENISNDILVENNFFSCDDGTGTNGGCGGGSFYIDPKGETISNVVIRHNSTPNSFGHGSGTYTNVTYRGNVAGAHTCGDGITFEYNVKAPGRRVAGTDTVADADFVDEGTFDYHLQSGAAAIDFVPSTGPSDRHRRGLASDRFRLRRRRGREGVTSGRLPVQRLEPLRQRQRRHPHGCADHCCCRVQTGGAHG